MPHQGYRLPIFWLTVNKIKSLLDFNLTKSTQLCHKNSIKEHEKMINLEVFWSLIWRM